MKLNLIPAHMVKVGDWIETQGGEFGEVKKIEEINSDSGLDPLFFDCARWQKSNAQVVHLDEDLILVGSEEN